MTSCSLGAERRTSPTTLVVLAAAIAVIVAFLMGGNASAAQVTLAWDANTEPDLAGYRVHYGTASGTYTQVAEAGLSTTLLLDGLEEGTTYYFAATAYDLGGSESGFSNEVVLQAVPVQTVLFADDFSDGNRSGDPDWDQISGGWTVNRADNYVTAGDLANRSLVADPAVADFAAGSIEARVKLSSIFVTAANAYLVFGWQDPQHYRYVRLKTTGVTIGQAGDTLEELKGVKARAGMQALGGPIRTGRWYLVRVDVAPTGSVSVYLDNAADPVLTYDFAASAPGRVGLISKQAKTSFDDYAVRGPAPIF